MPYYYSLTIVIADKQNLSHVVIESTAPKLFLYDETSKVEIICIKYKLSSEQTWKMWTKLIAIYFQWIWKKLNYIHCTLWVWDNKRTVVKALQRACNFWLCLSISVVIREHWSREVGMDPLPSFLIFSAFKNKIFTTFTHWTKII